jgi:hypothetical protein
MSQPKYKVGDKVVIRPGIAEVHATIQEVQKRPDGDLYVVYVGKYEPALTIKEGCILRLR